MISIQKLFGKKDVFFDLLAASANQAKASVQALHKLLSNPGDTQCLDAFVISRKEDKKITQQIDEALCRTFVTELEREDIEALANALYKIPKTAEKIAERTQITRDRIKGVDFSRHIELMDRAAEIVVTMISELRNLHLERVKVLNEQLQQVEANADKLVLQCLKEIYAPGMDSVQVVILKDVYDLIEKVVDRCRDAGNIVAHIVLKNS
jgi:uncharacterized protein Yka (UPF0111/DUF47 family)